MAVPIATQGTLSVGANAKSADQVDGQFQNIGKGKVTLICFASADGLNATLNVGGISLIDDKEIPFFGTTGGMDVSAHVMATQVVNGGRVELFFRETAGAGRTVDYLLLFEPQ